MSLLEEVRIDVLNFLMENWCQST